MSESVYRRGPRMYYGQRKTHGWIGTSGVIIPGVCDPSASLVLAEAAAIINAAAAEALVTGTEGLAIGPLTSGDAVLVGTEGRGVVTCS